jgi:ProP effector
MKSQQSKTLAVIIQLAEAFPKCFFVLEYRRRPLKIGISTDLIAKVAIPPKELARAMGLYCRSDHYLGRMRKGAWRLDLDGNVTGEVTAEEEQHAKAKITAIKAKRARRAAAAKVDEAALQAATLKASLARLREAGRQRAA